MISSLEVFNARPDAPELALGDLMANQDPIQVRNIEGLGPVKADFATQALATRGVLIQGSSVGARNIVLTLGLNPDWVEYTVAELRQLCYRYFLPEQWVKLRFTSRVLPQVDIEGYVESVEPNIFSEDPEMQVSILCPRPDFIEPIAHEITGVVQAQSGEVIPTSLLYEGTVETGFQLIVGDEDLSLDAEQSFVGLYITVNDDQFQVLDLDITVDQYFLLNTAPGSKQALLVNLSSGFRINYLRKSFPLYGKWPILRPGRQDIGIVGGGVESSAVPWKLAYYNRYAGF